MAGDGGGGVRDLVVQTWVMYSIGIALYLLRVYARFQRLGWKWQAEDIVMLTGVGWYTAFVVTNIQLAEGGGGTLYLPGQFETFTPEDIASRVQFAKVEFASEQCMVNVVWTTKACMLIIYYRLTFNLKQQFWVKLCAAYTLASFVAVQLTLFLNCRPFSGYWTLPPPQEECATYFHFEVINAVFNISSDVAILVVIVPTLWKMNMWAREKLPVVFIFSLGFFLIICAIVSKYFTFRDIFDTSYQFWYLREASVAIYISNLPYIWSFFRRTIRFLRASTAVNNITNSTTKNTSSSQRRHNIYDGSGSGTSPFQPNTGHGFISSVSSNVDEIEINGFDGRESNEHIIAEDGTVSHTGDDMRLENGADWSRSYRIQKTTEIHVTNNRFSQAKDII
ncbi:hypothetical protein BGW36DRAFT_401654 [Talaromyces proteolyticus]|uniref:Rhodopsin domain-containing protein n=1 Tax=Talaromyces proteolyticus TaxID=1131652 RepID=A0AAD4KG31_9EURO|nr:uncharacterized protein BGW36DRAFT_401654 [Talaromyces proteolyticus]KAH8690293.1 hypothetical protein BGW36DRAFT_401654 [Talaromyces proteolyticus]